jgi:hypothetical protein
MAQQLPTDFPIDPVTTSGTALADILNRMNEANNSNNAGATPPAATFPGMIWLDTSATPSVMRIRNAGNTGWDTIPTSGSPGLFADGSVLAPGMAFASEPGLGWFRRSTGAIAFAAGGGRAFDFSSTAASSSTITIFPRAASGVGSVAMTNQPAAAAAYSVAAISCSPAGWTLIENHGYGRAQLLIQFNAAGYRFEPPDGNAGNTEIFLNKGTALLQNSIFGLMNGVNRWRMDIGDGTTEGGVSAGSSFRLLRFNNAGAYIDVPLSIDRADGTLALGSAASTNPVRLNGASIKMPAISGVAAASNVYMEGADENRIYRVTSSMRYKYDDEPMERTEMIYDLDPIWFRFKDDPLNAEWSYYGLGAEGVAAMDPRFAHFIKDDEGNLIPDGVQYDRLVVPVIAELKKLRDRVAALEGNP